MEISYLSDTNTKVIRSYTVIFVGRTLYMVPECSLTPVDKPGLLICFDKFYK